MKSLTQLEVETNWTGVNSVSVDANKDLVTEERRGDSRQKNDGNKDAGGGDKKEKDVEGGGDKKKADGEDAKPVGGDREKKKEGVGGDDKKEKALFGGGDYPILISEN
ncbi:hypothetical protein ACFE04_010417 [Oxalis oulophora]